MVSKQPQYLSPPMQAVLKPHFLHSRAQQIAITYTISIDELRDLLILWIPHDSQIHNHRKI